MSDVDLDQAVALLEELSERCRAAGVECTTTVVGGAAMLLRGSRRGTTHDIDVVIEGDRRIHEVARRMADEFGLPHAWFNEGAKAWAPASDGLETEIARGVLVASEQTILAMKLVAGRNRDQSDIRELVDILGLRTTDDIMRVVEERYEPDDTALGPGGLDDLRMTVEQAGYSSTP